METVVDGLSTLARHGQTVDELEPIALDDVVAEAHDTARATGASVEAPTSTVEADRTRLHELFVNLFEFLGSNGGTVVEVTTHDDGFAVATDWVPPERLSADQLFEYTGGLTDTKTGLALPKVRTLARVQGWTVDLERTDDGSRLVVHDVRVRDDVEASP